MKYSIVLTRAAQADLEAITDQRTVKAIEREIDRLELEPDQERHLLSGDLQGYYRVRAAGQRYRVVYAVQKIKSRVLVVLVAIRKEGDVEDVYKIAHKRLKVFQEKHNPKKPVVKTKTKKP